MAEANHTYRVTLPCGRIETQKSVRVYTHAVIGQGFEDRWSVRSYCGSRQLAEKALAQHSKGFRNLQIIELGA